MSDTSSTGAASSSDATSEAAQAAVAANIQFSTERLARILESLYGDSGVAGAGVAEQQTGDIAGDFASLLPTINWSTWKAGDSDTAGLVANGGLKELLDRVELTIRGMTDAAMERMGNVLAEGIAAGDSNQTIARNMKDIVADPKRAMVIARTEVARAMGTSTLDSFHDNEIGQWTWNPTEGACPICLKYAAEGPYDVGSGPDFPAHPNCRCDPRAVLDIDKGLLHDVEGELRDEDGKWSTGGGSGWKPSMSTDEADEWTKDSAIKATVYHGTAASNVKDIESSGFDLSKTGSATGMLQGKGVYLAGDMDAAEGFAAGRDGNQKPGVLALKLNVKHPADTKESFAIIKQAESESGGPYGDKFGNRVAELAREQGFDSFHITYGNMAWVMKTGMAQWDGIGPKPTEADLVHEYVVFNPKHITVVRKKK